MLKTVVSVVFLIVLCPAPPSLALDASPQSLRYVFAFFRHGIRTPVMYGVPNDVNKDKYVDLSAGILGGLSTAGKQQMYRIGKALKIRYGDFTGDYREDRVYVSSTEVSRVIMSALSVMAGMFPSHIFKNVPWQPIPVWHNTLDMDKSVVFMDRQFPSVASKMCPKYATLASKPRETFKSKDTRPSYAKIYQLVQKYTNDPDINSPEQLTAIFDTFYSAERNGLNLPHWAIFPHLGLGNKPIYPDLLLPFVSEYFSTKIYHEKNEDMLNFFSGPLFNAINVKLLKKSTNMDSPDKLWIHFTHDTTIYALLRALKFKEPLTAEPGDGIIFELHEVKDNTYVKIFIHEANSNTLKEIISPQCPFPCSLAMFTTRFKAMTPQQWTLKCAIK